MRVVLINTPNPRIRPGDEEENLGLGYLAAVLRQAGHEVTLIDGTLERQTPAAIARRVSGGRYDLVGISILFQESLRSGLALVDVVRSSLPNAVIVAGGQPPTFLHRELLELSPGLDAVVLGEAEEVIARLAGGPTRDLPGLAFRHQGQVQVTARPPLLTSLDRLPFPARDLLHRVPRRDGSAQVSRSRGCWGACSFCSLRAFYAGAEGPVWRTRSPASVVAEIEHLRSRHGVHTINFCDDNFIGPGERGREQARALAQALLEAGVRVKFTFACRADDVEEELFHLLKQAGLTKVFLGIESGVQAVLDRFGKRVSVEQNLAALDTLRRLGIRPVVGFIAFDPDTTWEEFSANLAFLERAFGSWSEVKRHLSLPLNIMEVYDGTPIANRLREQGRLHGDILGYTYDIPDARTRALVRAIVLTRRCLYPLRNVWLRRQAGRAPKS